LRNVLIFGNSSSGKSTLAKKLHKEHGLAHLDLDLLAWLPTTPPTRKPLEESRVEIEAFISSNALWVIEGCYADLLEFAAPASEEIIFMNLPIDTCLDNAKRRPWEPHKYPSKEAQDANLDMLLKWISQYEERTDSFSKTMHQQFFDRYQKSKAMINHNP